MKFKLKLDQSQIIIIYLYYQFLQIQNFIIMVNLHLIYNINFINIKMDLNQMLNMIFFYYFMFIKLEFMFRILFLLQNLLPLQQYYYILYMKQII